MSEVLKVILLLGNISFLLSFSNGIVACSFDRLLLHLA